jgi:hypothetical protein
MADIIRMLKSHNPNTRPAPPLRPRDMKVCKASVEWVETTTLRMVKCEGTVFMYHPAEATNKACGKIYDDMRE